MSDVKNVWSAERYAEARRVQERMIRIVRLLHNTVDVEEAEDLINIACLDSDDDIHFEPMAIYHNDKAILTIDPTTIQGGIQEDEEVAIILNEEMDLEILGEERIIHVVGEVEEPQARILKGASK